MGLAGLGTAVSQSNAIYMPVMANAVNPGASILVAASNAPPSVRQAAQYVCDGLNDQTTIHWAMNELGDQGGLIQLSEGTFYCTSAVRMKRQVALCGKGPATILRADYSWNSWETAVLVSDHPTIHDTFVGFLAIDGNRGEVDVGGIYYEITSRDQFPVGPDAAHTFTHLYVYHTRSHGIEITGTYMRSTKMSDVRVYGVGNSSTTQSHGFYIRSSDGFYSQCEAGDCTGAGFVIDGSNNHFTACKGWYADRVGWLVASPRNHFAGCSAQDNYEHGFYIRTGPNSFVGCHADSNGWNQQEANPAVYADGFHLASGGHIQLVGCSAYDRNENNRGPRQRYGFVASHAVSYCQIMGTAENNAQGALYLSDGIDDTNWIQVSGS